MSKDKEIELLRQRYNHVANPDELKVYDGRGKGVDVYVCESCGEFFYTRYKDKGVTPFIIRCRKCGHSAQHKHTISEVEAYMYHCDVKNCVRPSFDWVVKHRFDNGVIEHILNGGLFLEDEL